MGGRRRRRRVEPTDDWEQLALLCRWPEQRAYEEIRPLTLFGSSVAERASETGTPERTLYRRLGCFEAEGMEGLFGSEAARRKRLPPALRRLIVDLKAEYPAFNPNEIANACYVRFGRRPDRKTVVRVLGRVGRATGSRLSQCTRIGTAYRFASHRARPSTPPASASCDRTSTSYSCQPRPP